MSCVRGESAANERGGEGVYIPEPKKLAVTGQTTHLSELPILHRNFRSGEEQISREPFAGRYTELPRGVGTSDEFKNCRPRAFCRN